MFGNVFSDFFSLLAPKPVITHRIPEPRRDYIEARNEVGELIILDMQNAHLSEPMPIRMDRTQHGETPNPPLEV